MTRVSLRWIAGSAVLLVLVATSAAIVVTRTSGGQTAAPAAASPTCAAVLLRDWSDGRIDRTYPIRCYRSALKALPSDLQVYSSAPDDIAQALSQRIIQSHTRAPAAKTSKARHLAAVERQRRGDAASAR